MQLSEVRCTVHQERLQNSTRHLLLSIHGGEIGSTKIRVSANPVQCRTCDKGRFAGTRPGGSVSKRVTMRTANAKISSCPRPRPLKAGQATTRTHDMFTGVSAAACIVFVLLAKQVYWAAAASYGSLVPRRTQVRAKFEIEGQWETSPRTKRQHMHARRNRCSPRVQRRDVNVRWWLVGAQDEENNARNEN